MMLLWFLAPGRPICKATAVSRRCRRCSWTRRIGVHPCGICSLTHITTRDQRTNTLAALRPWGIPCWSLSEARS
ncbi:hypothetical protein CTA2_2518 [Colletotrichum tanaceti]|nr:hypothetical protein CTA2_2518 [Colletotrichum tanaceti]